MELERNYTYQSDKLVWAFCVQNPFRFNKEDLEDTVLSGGQNERMGTSREFLILGKAVLQQESIKSGTKKDE